MKRVKEACLSQTLHFSTTDPVGRETRARLVREEVDMYKASLDRRKVQYRIVSEESQADGSVLLKILRQNAAYPVGSYLD